jgi:hypothetical protein
MGNNLFIGTSEELRNVPGVREISVEVSQFVTR